MYMQNSSSNNVFGSYNNQGNNLNKGLFGNAGNPSGLTNTNTSNLFGGSKPQQTNNMMVNKNLFSMGGNTGGLDANKSIYDNMNNQSNLGNKNLFGGSGMNNNSMQSGGGMGRNSLFMNTNNQSNLNMKNIFDSSSNLNNTQGANLSNKGLFGGLQQNNQSSSGGNLFGNLSSQTNTGGMYSGLSSGANQNKGTGLFGASGNTNQVSSTSSIFGSTSAMGQNKLGGVFGNLQSADQNAQNAGNTNNSLFGGMSGNQLKPMSTGSNLFGGMSTNTTANTGTSNLFGNNNAASGMNQNKPGGFFGNLQGSNQGTTGSSMFGNSSNNTASGMNQNKSGVFFGNLQGSNQGTTGSSMFGGMGSGMNQNKPGGLLGNLQSPNQGATGTTTNSSLFGSSASGMNQNRGTTLFSGMSNTGTSTTNTTNNLFGGTSTMGQNKLGGVFGNLQSTDQNAQNAGNTNNSLFGGMSGNQLKPMSTGSNLFGGMSTNTTSNTGTSNLFGNNNAASGMNQNKPSSNIFGSLSSTTQPAGATTSSSTTTGNIFGSTQTQNQGMGSNVFGSSMGMNQNKFGNIFGGTNTNQSSTMGSTFGNTGLGTSGISSTPALGSGTSTTTGLGGGLGLSSGGIGGTTTNTGLGMSGLTNTTGGTTTGISSSTGSSNLFGGLSSTSNTNTMSLGDNKNLFGSKPGFSLGATTTASGQSSTNLSLGTNLGGGLLSPSLNTTTSSGLGTNLGTTTTGSTNLLGGLTGGIGSTSTLGAGTTPSPTIGIGSTTTNLSSNTNALNNTSLGGNLLSSGSSMNQTGISFLGDKNLIGGNQGSMQSNLLTVGSKDKSNDLLTNKLSINKESSESQVKTTKFDDDIVISKKKEDIFNKAYDDENDISNDEINLIKSQDGTFYNYINLIINDNINDIQKTTFSLLNDHDSLMWDNFKSNIFKNFVDYLVNFKQKKNQKIIKSNVLDLDQHEFQILIWLYNINSYKIDFIPFKSFYYLLLSDTNLNYSKMFISNSDKSILPRNFVEINDHYYMNYKSYFLKSQINKHHDSYSALNREGIGNSSNGGVSGNSIPVGASNSVLDIDSIYKQILKDILNSLLNMNLSITKENIKKKEKDEYYENGDPNTKNNANSGNSYTYENLLLNYLFGTLQHLHDKFYKLEISNYLSKDLNQIDEYFVDTKSNEIFSYCYDNFYKNEMDKENCTIHFFFYLVNIMFRCGNYIGLIQIIKNDEFIKNLNIDSYLNDFIILLIRILLLIYNQSNEISIFENMKIDIDCSDIFKKKIHMSNLINFFHSILYLCSNNIYAYDLLCILFSDIFYKKGNMYTNREKKIEMKNIFYYVQKKKRSSTYVDNNSDRNSGNEDNYDSEGENNNIDRGSNSANNNKGGKSKGSESKGSFLDVFTNMLHKSKKSKDDEEDEPFETMEINEEIEKLNRENMSKSNTEMLGITNKYSYNFEYCNIETSIWIELSLFLSKNFDLYGSKFQENFDILDTNLSYYNYDDDNNAFLNDTKHKRDMINSKIEELFISISNCIINENREYFSVCSKLRVDDVINNFIIVDGKISEKVKSSVFKVLRTNFLLYIKLFYYLLLVGNIYVTVGFLSCISNNIQRILLVLTIFLHKNNVFENSKLNNIKIKTLGFLKLKNDNNTILYNSKDINDNVPAGSDNMNLILLSMNNTDIPFDYFLLRNNNINILLKATYLLNLKTNISIKLLKSIVQENQGILLNESIIGHINNDGNIFYGKLHDFLFLFKNKVKSRRNIKCFFLMYYVLYKKKFYNSNILRKVRKEIDSEYHYKCRNFKFVPNKNINTLNKISLDNSIINVHSSILYKISQFYSILAYFANQRKNYIVSFICYYILNDEQSAINSLLRIYNDELIYYYFNNEKEYGYIRKCAFRFYHLAKNMWPSNVKLESIEQKSYLVLSILFMKKKMFEEAFSIFSLALIPDNMLEKLSTADYYNIDLSSNFLVTLRELCKKNYKISELVDQSMIRSVVKFLLPIKDKLDAQVVESINYLGSLTF